MSGNYREGADVALEPSRRMSGHSGTGILGVARVNFHQKIIIESNVPLGQRENKGTSSVPEECREIIERPPCLLILGAASRKTEALIGVAPVDTRSVP